MEYVRVVSVYMVFKDMKHYARMTVVRKETQGLGPGKSSELSLGTRRGVSKGDSEVASELEERRAYPGSRVPI